MFNNLPVRHKFIHVDELVFDNDTKTLEDLIREEKLMNFFILAEYDWVFAIAKSLEVNRKVGNSYI